MRIVLQRVSRASVSVDSVSVGQIGCGLLLLVGIGAEDTAEKLRPMAEKILNLRVFPDDAGKFQYSLRDTKGELLLIPQFTLFGDTSKGRRPEFFGAMRPEGAAHLFESLAQIFKDLAGGVVEKGVFQAHMQVELINDGPVTLILEA